MLRGRLDGSARGETTVIAAAPDLGLPIGLGADWLIERYLPVGPIFA